VAAEEQLTGRDPEPPAEHRKRTEFDRAVSLVFAQGAADSTPSSNLAAGSGGPGSRWKQKLSGSYVRRAVSARFGRRGRVASGRGGGAAEEGSEEEEAEGAGKSSLKRGKSGELQLRSPAPSQDCIAQLSAMLCHPSIPLLLVLV
jgi:hypothetical protein